MRLHKILLGAIILLGFTAGLSAQKKLVIIGSSTSACVSVDAVTECYVGRLNSYYNKLVPYDTGIDNHLARGGTNCYNGMPSSYVSPYGAGSIYLPLTDVNITAALTLNPDVILVNYPTNAYDVLSINEIMFCLRTIKNEANKNGVPCYITTSQPRTTPPTFNVPAVKLKLAILKDSILAAFGNYAIDFYTGLFNPADSTILYDSGDQTHMNGTGHNILFQRVLAKNVFGAPVPACITNTSPANGTTITTQTTATLVWPAAANATAYDVYIWTGATAPATPTATVTSTSYTASGLTASTPYNWYIVPKNSTGAAASCDVAGKTSFTTAPIPPPPCATNTAPADASTIAAQTTATLTWNAAATASSYDVYIWTGATAPATPTANVTSTSYTASSLTASTAYSWYVVPKNSTGPATGCSSTSKTSFTTAPIPVPACATNTAPVNGSTIATQTTATLTWNAAATASSYDVYIWTGATAPATPTANVTSTSYTASGLTASTAYSWYVVPKNSTGPATGCSATSKTSFTTAPIPVPVCANNASPANGSTIATQTIATLTWGAAATASSYDVYIWTGATAPATPMATVTSTSYTASSLTAFTPYNWFVVPKNSTGPATGCSTSSQTSFTTAPIPVPVCANNASPANGSTIATQTIATLTWSAAATASSYDVYIWTGATAPATPTATVTSTSYTASSLTASTPYNWYVVPKNSTGPATGCSTSSQTSFTTAPIPVPVCAGNITPADGSTTAAQTTATLTWNAAATATSYDVYVWTGTAEPTTPTTNVTATTYSLTGLIAGTLYNWYVVPKNSTGPATGCNTSSKTSFNSAPIPAPGCVTNTAPADGSTVAAQTTATLTWTAAVNALSYDVYVWTGTVVPATATVNVTATSYTATGLVAGTVYYWSVIPKNASGPATGCSTTSKTSFTTAAIIIPAPACVTNTAPADASTIATQTTASLTWGVAANATSYDVYIWTGTAAPVTPTANVTAAAYVVTGLTASTSYNWLVVAKNATGAAAGCARTSFTTAAVVIPAPVCAANISPAAGSTIGTQTSAALTWGVAANASAYDIYIWPNGSAAPTAPIATVSATSYTATGLNAATLYYWFVVAKNASGVATGCSTTSFTTAEAPVVIVPGTGTGLLGAYYNGTNIAGAPLLTRLDPTINFEYFSQSPAPGIVPQDYYSVRWAGQVQAVYSETYTFYTTSDDGIRLWINGVPMVSDWNKQDATEKSGSFTMVAGQKYDIIIEYYEATGYATTKLSWSSPSTPKSIVPALQLYPAAAVLPTAPACALNSSPVNGVTVSTLTTASLVWQSSAIATSYDVYIWAGNAVSTTPVANVTGTSYDVTGLTAGATYSWYVVPRNATGPATGCDAVSASVFNTTAAAPITGTGLIGNYYAGNALSGTPLLTRVDSTINFDLTWMSPAPGIVPEDYYSVRWTGQVMPQYSETYTFYTTSDDGIRLWVNGILLVNNWVRQGATELNGSLTLVAGQKYDIVIEYYEAAGYAVTKLAWSSPSTPKAIVPASQLYPQFVAPLIDPATVIRQAALSTDVVSSAPASISATISPNPLLPGNMARLLINSNKTGSVMVNTVNSNGTIISSKKVNLVTGVNTTTVNTYGLPQGFYIINITGCERPLDMKMLLNK